MQIIIPSEKRAHKETHVHHCPIHHRGKALGKCSDLCMISEQNEICQKTLRGTGLSFHSFPCINCQIVWRSQYGGDLLVDAFVSLEQAARLTHVAPDDSVAQREAFEAETNPEVEEIKDAAKRI